MTNAFTHIDNHISMYCGGQLLPRVSDLIVRLDCTRSSKGRPQSTSARVKVCRRPSVPKSRRWVLTIAVLSKTSIGVFGPIISIETLMLLYALLSYVDMCLLDFIILPLQVYGIQRYCK